MFGKYFGASDSIYLKYIVAPFDAGGGYSRKNFICMRTKEYDLYKQGKGLAHEIAHFWWQGASVTTWEDWLNEAFAEYSMLLYVRERYGIENFNKLIEEYKARTNNLPAVWGIDRNCDQAYTVLYEKGALILFELEKKIGEKKFLNLLRKVASDNIHSTSDLLSIINEGQQGNVSSWLENKLKES